MATLSARQVAAFRAAMLTGSITRAATMLHLTQPAVSRLIKDFELALGLSLFTRRGSSIAPTREASIIFAEVERVYAGLDRIVELAAELRNEPSQAIRIAAFPSMASGFLPRFVAKLHARAPIIRPSIIGLPSLGVIESVAKEECDFGVVAFAPEDPRVAVVHLEPIPLVAVLPNGHLLGNCEYLEPKDFADQAFVSSTATVMHLRIEGVFTQHRVVPRIVAQTQLSATACAMVSAGMCMSIVDPFAAENAMAVGVLVKPFRPTIYVELAYILPVKKEPFALVTETMKALMADVASLRARQ